MTSVGMSIRGYGQVLAAAAGDCALTRRTRASARAWRPGNARRVQLGALCLLFVIATGGCSPINVDSTYGRRRGNPGEESVNGTAVLAAMFEDAGHRVVSRGRLSPKLEEFDTVVWFPNDFAGPTREQRQYLEEWLASSPERTLVYVGRDYDAAITYWRKVQKLAPPSQAAEVARRLALSQALHDRKRAEMPNGKSFDWFVMRRDAPLRTVSTLSGPWASGIDASKTEIQLAGRLEIPSQSDIKKWVGVDEEWSGLPKYEPLLSSGDDLIACRIQFPGWDGSQLIFVANGSFLLNLSLVNHEHRKLAAKLIAACSPPGRVMFLESDEGGPPVYEQEPGANAPTGFEVFTVWPIGVILVHLTALGLLACVALFPLFGRPRQLWQRSTADFGQHVEALGELLELTGDRDYAEQRLKAYQEHVRRDTGQT